MDAEAICQHLFTRIPSEFFHSPTLAFEFVQFCRDNLPLFGRNLGILKLSFPNLFKAGSLVPGPERGLGCLVWGVQWPHLVLGPRAQLLPGLSVSGLGCRWRASGRAAGVLTSQMPPRLSCGPGLALPEGLMPRSVLSPAWRALLWPSLRAWPCGAAGV